jgi:hypothetical protein
MLKVQGMGMLIAFAVWFFIGEAIAGTASARGNNNFGRGNSHCGGCHYSNWNNGCHWRGNVVNHGYWSENRNLTEVPRIQWQGTLNAATLNPTAGSLIFVAPEEVLKKTGFGGKASHANAAAINSAGSPFDYQDVAEAIRFTGIKAAKIAPSDNNRDQLRVWGVNRVPAAIFLSNDGKVLGIQQGESFSRQRILACIKAMPLRAIASEKTVQKEKPDTKPVTLIEQERSTTEESIEAKREREKQWLFLEL